MDVAVLPPLVCMCWWRCRECITTISHTLWTVITKCFVFAQCNWTTVLWQIERGKTWWRSLAWLLTKSTSDYRVFWTEIVDVLGKGYLICSLFPSPYRGGRGKLAAWSKGRRAERWSIKLANHFLFSLRTAVDWWKKASPSSQSASKRICRFGPSSSWLHVVEGTRHEGENGSNMFNASMLLDYIVNWNKSSGTVLCKNKSWCFSS